MVEHQLTIDEQIRRRLWNITFNQTINAFSVFPRDSSPVLIHTLALTKALAPTLILIDYSFFYKLNSHSLMLKNLPMADTNPPAPNIFIFF